MQHGTFFWPKFDRLLTRHLATLKKLTFLNVWRNSDNANTSYPSITSMHLWQVYLVESTSDSSLNSRIFGNDSDRQTWGPGMRHLRLDRVNINNFPVNSIDHEPDTLKQLKVLILRTAVEQVSDPLSGIGFRGLPYPVLPFGPDLPTDINSLRESRIAQKIAVQDLPSLRIIMVGKFKYWVQEMYPNKGSRKVWFLRRALEDPEQEKEILRTINRNDWDFLADRSDALGEDRTEEARRWANRAVYRNKSLSCA